MVPTDCLGMILTSHLYHDDIRDGSKRVYHTLSIGVQKVPCSTMVVPEILAQTIALCQSFWPEQNGRQISVAVSERQQAICSSEGLEVIGTGGFGDSVQYS